MAGVFWRAVTPAIQTQPPPAALLLPQLPPLKDPLAPVLATAQAQEAALQAEAAAGPLVIDLPDLEGEYNLPNTVTGNSYSPDLGYSSANAQATASASLGQHMCS
jgi:hypothetical protein